MGRDDAKLTEVNDSDIRIYDLDLRKKVRGVWDENIPLINHLVIEGRGISPDVLNSETGLKNAADRFCEDIKVAVVEKRVHKFTPVGKTLFYILEESHLSVHTWPESSYLHLDLVTCQKSERRPIEVVDVFMQAFGAKGARIIKLRY
jgi:S-adenosylmethionine decarboxylase